MPWKKKINLCKRDIGKLPRDILARAEIYVDSIISAEINFQLSDSIVFPEKPVKPGWPGPIIIPETIRARPIFDPKTKYHPVKASISQKYFRYLTSNTDDDPYNIN